MKRELIIELISAINEEHISATLESIERQKTRRKQLSMTLATAACACLVVGAFFVGAHFASKPAPVTPPVPGTGTSTYTETDPATEPTPVIPDDFVIEDGVLLSYNGADTDVVVPEEVRTITATSFTTGNTDIRTISLGRNVDEIDESAFTGLTSLDGISVDEENETYVSENGVLGKRDGTVYFASVRTEEDNDAFIDALIVMAQNYNEYRDVTKFIIGNAELEANIYVGINGEGIEAASCEIFSVSAYGYKKTFDMSYSFYPNGYFRIYQAEDAFVFGNVYSNGENGQFYVFTKDGVYEEKNRMTEEERNNGVQNYNKIITSFTIREDGKLGYEKRPAKYVFSKGFGREIFNAVSRDELAREEGYVTFGDGVMEFIPERTYSIGEIFDLDAYYAEEVQSAKEAGIEKYPKNEDGIPTRGNVPIFDALDELLAYNAERYVEATNYTSNTVYLLQPEDEPTPA